MSRPRHSWQHLSDPSPNRSLFRCRNCRVQVLTTTGYPAYTERELWDGVPMPKLAPRPPCKPRTTLAD